MGPLQSLPAVRLLTTSVGRTSLTSRGPLGRLMRGALGRRLDRSEHAAIARIEARRRELEGREDLLPFEEADGTHHRAVGELCRTASKPHRWAELLFRLIRARRPERCLELGSCVGLSASYQGAALDLNGTGRLVTVEGRPAVAAVAAETVARLGLDERVESRVGWFADVLDEVLADLGSVDHAFVDGHHEGSATLHYFGRILPCLSSGAIVIVDDVAWSSDMRAAWEEIAGHPRTADALDLEQLGVWMRE